MGEFIEFFRFDGIGGHMCMGGRRIRIHHQNGDGTMFAWNLGIIRELWFVHALLHLHRICRQILYKEKAFYRKFWRLSSCPNPPYYGKAILNGQFTEFRQFVGKFDHRGIRGRRIRYYHQTCSGTNFAGIGLHYCTKFALYSKTVCLTDTVMSPSCFSSDFTYGEGILAKILEMCQLSKMQLLGHFYVSIYRIRSI